MARIKQIRPLSEILKSSEMQSIVLAKAEAIRAIAAQDPNEFYVETLDVHAWSSRDRVHGQVGAAKEIGARVEAKRGTLGRALGASGG
jgi:hypothetical protein